LADQLDPITEGIANMAVESPSPIFLARRHCKLHVIDSRERIAIHGIIRIAHTDSTIPTTSAGPEI
jgi:hypothetical protein